MSATRRIGLRRLLAPSAALLGAALLVSACSSGGSDSGQSSTGPDATSSGGYTAPASDITATLTISNWGDPADQEVYKAAAERFKTKYPNVTVNDNFTPITT